MKTPQRQPLTKQTVDALREGIADGLWAACLPGERELCRHLQVSRPTLRTALEILRREGLIAVRQGKRSAILRQKRGRLRPTSDSVALVSKFPLYSMSRNRIFLFDYMHRVLQERGLRLEIVSHPAFGTNLPDRAFQYLRERGDFRAFVLTLSSPAVQRWFCDKALPVIVLGSTFPGLALPSIDSDYPSMGHHAAGILLGKGHRRIMGIVPEANHAGDLETEESFLKTLRHSSRNAAKCRVIRHGLSSRDLIKKIAPFLDLPEPPTAFFVINAFAATTLVTHLLSRGLRIPRDVSVVTRDHDPLLDWIQPPVAHYVYPLRRIASRISRMVMEMPTSGPFPMKHIRIMPQFNNAESVGPCSARTPHESPSKEKPAVKTSRENQTHFRKRNY